MDPLSITLAAITLATALKDVIAIAQEIEESFEKVSQNLQTAQKLSREVLQTLVKLQDFCNQHYEVLNGSVEMNTALMELMRDMQVVHNNCVELIPPLSHKTIGRIRVTLHAWKNRNRVEGSLRELKHKVDQCYSMFMMFAVMRIERHLIVLTSSTTRRSILTGNQESRTQVMRGRQTFPPTKNYPEQQISVLGVSDERVISFVGSSFNTMSKIPANISEDAILDMYLRFQVNAIDQTLAQLCAGDLSPYGEPLVEFPPFDLFIRNYFAGNRKVFHQHIVKQTLDIQSALRTNSRSVPIHEGAWELFDLSFDLYDLDMFEEGATICLWSVNLFKTMVKLNSKIYLPYLIHILLFLSKLYMDHNLDAAFDVITQSVDLSRSLQTPTTGEELKVQFADCLMTSSVVFAAKGEHEQAIQDVREAVDVLEGIFIEKAIHEDVMETGFVLKKFNWDQLLGILPDVVISEYARALHKFSGLASNMGFVADAAKIEIRALQTFRIISPPYHHAYFQAEIAVILSHFAGQDFRPFVTNEEAYSYSKESETFYRKRFDQNPKKYGQDLCNVLWGQAVILRDLNREEDALKVWQDMSNIAREVIDDHIYIARALCNLSRSFRCLSLHDQADSTLSESMKNYHMVLQTPSNTEANAYYELALDLYLADHHDKAVQVAENAVTQYRALAFRDADQYLKDLARSLNLLATILMHGEQYERALTEAYEAVKLLETLIQTDSSLLSEYLEALTINLDAAELLDDARKSIQRSEYIVGLYRELVKGFPDQEWNLADATTRHSRILAMHDRLPEAIRFRQEAIEWYRSHPAKDVDSAARYSHCLTSQGNAWERSGHLERALELIQQAVVVGKPYSFDSPTVASDTVEAMYYAGHLMCDLGRFDEAVVTSLEALDFARKVTLDNIDDLVRSLKVAARSYRLSKKPEKAIEFMKEAIEICQRDDMISISKTRKFNLITLPQCIRALSEGLADTGDEAGALVHAREAVSAALKLKAEPDLPWSAVEETYMFALLNLSLRLLATGSPSIGLDHVAEVKEFYRKSLEKWNKDNIEYAFVIRIHAIFHCALGRHDEGIALKTEFMELRKRLKLTFPSIADLADIFWAGESARQSWVSILSKLECHHQDQD